jgi:hypothetical protein
VWDSVEKPQRLLRPSGSTSLVRLRQQRPSAHAAAVGRQPGEALERKRGQRGLGRTAGRGPGSGWGSHRGPYTETWGRGSPKNINRPVRVRKVESATVQVWACRSAPRTETKLKRSAL